MRPEDPRNDRTKIAGWQTRKRGLCSIGEICKLQCKLSLVCSKQKEKKEEKGKKENQAAMVESLEQRKRRHGVSSS